MASRPGPNSPAFAGFPDRAQAVALPSLFFTAVLPQIQDMAEIKVCLHLFWQLGQVRRYPRFVTYAELASDSVLRSGLGVADPSAALAQATARGTLLTLTMEQNGVRHRLYFINDAPSRRAVDRIARGELALDLGEPGPGEGAAELAPPSPQPASIFALYEQNIGLLTPMLAEELAQAEKTYPAAWIEEAFREAVHLNKRNWRYISRILERWATEGKDHGEARRHPETGQPPRPGRGRPRHPIWG